MGRNEVGNILFSMFEADVPFSFYEREEFS